VTNEYEVTSTNKVRQLREKAAYDKPSLHAVLDSALVASVAFVEDGNPVVTPMIYGRDGETIYLHGARKARVVRMLEQTDRACLNVTHVDGLVLARSAFHSSMRYRSATVFGKPTLVSSAEEKVHGMRVISEHLMRGRWDELREPLENEVKMTGVIALEIESASAKISDGMPNDEDEDYNTPIWAGVLPLHSTFTTLQDDGRILPGIEPSAVIRALEGKLL
jgi:nitroimidazol reductase NimA-like FMN-containing flavoprotein (pyridoxamine 5'-phosphate oxidase superfamily)